MEATLTRRDAVFEEYRPVMFGVAYRMLGSVAEAEDIVQEAYLRFRASEADPANPRAFLVTIVTRLCLDVLKSARVKREEYIGPWLPEPLIQRNAVLPGPEDAVAHEDDISLAFLVMLEELGPAERAVFLLREVFDYDYFDIAQMVGKSEVACRQIFRRARERLAHRQHRFTASYSERAALTVRFLAAANEGDMAGLLEMLAPDSVAISDGGGKVAAAMRPIYGAERIARFVAGLAKKDPAASIEFADVNGSPGVLMLSKRDRVKTVMVLEIVDGRITTVFAMRNPDKLRRAG